MASNYKTPGVYVEEIPSLPASVAQVETAIPAFIGYTEKATSRGEDLSMVPTRIKSFPEYVELFGGPQKQAGITVEVEEITGDDPSITIRANQPTEPSKFLMFYSLKMYFDNGGGPCYIVSVGDYSAAPAKGPLFDNTSNGLDKVEQEDEPTLILFPDATSLSAGDLTGAYVAALAQCKKLGDRFTIMDTHRSTLDAVNNNTNGFRKGIGMNNLKYGAAYFPFLKTSMSYTYDEDQVTVKYKGGDTADDFPDPAEEWKLAEKDDAGAYVATSIKGNKDALYNLIKAEIEQLKVTLPPSSAVAGVYATVDRNRGVWKAPANVSLNSVIKPVLKITSDDQAGLNVDTTAGKSINAIRSFTGKGVMVWGARTLAGNDNEWRYINVRRFFNMAEESIKKATERMVFEPNDANTWTRVQAMIENFLTLQWRNGALAGAVPEQAFFVNVGLGKTMTSLDILEGRMNIEIGMAVVRPAEFIILKFSHKMQES